MTMRFRRALFSKSPRFLAPQGPGAGGRTHAFLCALTRFEALAFRCSPTAPRSLARFPSESYEFKESGSNLFKRHPYAVGPMGHYTGYNPYAMGTTTGAMPMPMRNEL